MKVPLAWLREHCPVDLAADALADLLTAHGVQVERVLHPWADLSGVVAARVLDVRDHPDADKLCVTTIEAGAGERQVVAGVRNMRPGDVVPWAPPGATLPGFPGALERRTLRGQVSDGMLCSPKELGVSADHGGILILPDDLEPGADLKERLGLGDAVLEIEVHPNRPDLLSVYGVAREVAMATGAELREVDAAVDEAGEKAAEAATVEVVDPSGCPRYLARVIRGVRVAPSPLVARARLTAAGMRPVSNVVDATNYVLLELGHPMHPFDLDPLAGGGVVVRRAADGERMLTLDDVERTFLPEDLLIADHERAVGIAGVMGAAASEVSDATTNVLLESAYFDPTSILRTARRLGIRTEASIRFERGADPEVVPVAAARAARLIAEWGGGQVLAGAVDVGEPPRRSRVVLRAARASRLLGFEVEPGFAVEAFGRLGIGAEPAADGAVEVEVPGFRVDLAREEDLIEEVGRVRGYEHVPSRLPGIRQAGGLARDQRLRRRLQDALVAAGMLEASSLSFVPAGDAALFDDTRSRAVRVANPVSEDEAYLRTSLLPGLLRAARVTAGHRGRSVRLAEAGHVFHEAAEGGLTERDVVAVVLTGPAREEWPGDRRELDVLDAKGTLEHVLAVLGVAGWAVSPPAGRPWHPGRSAQVRVGERIVGELGEIHPGVAEAFDLPSRVAAFELEVGPLLEQAETDVLYSEISRFPPVRRDLAFLVDRGTRAGDVRAALVEAAGPLLEWAALFDVFEGAGLPEGKASLAFSIELRASDRTLTDEEAEAVVRAIADRLARDVGAELRSG